MKKTQDRKRTASEQVEDKLSDSQTLTDEQQIPIIFLPEKGDPIVVAIPKKPQEP